MTKYLNKKFSTYVSNIEQFSINSIHTSIRSGRQKFVVNKQIPTLEEIAKKELAKDFKKEFSKVKLSKNQRKQYREILNTYLEEGIKEATEVDYTKTIEELRNEGTLTNTMYNRLESVGIKTLEDMASKDKSFYLGIRNLNLGTLAPMHIRIEEKYGIEIPHDMYKKN